jgi:hypothetical protein
MHVAILSESSADEAAMRIIVDAILGIKTSSIPFNLQSRGWHAIRTVLPTITKQLHYRTNADGLVVIVDSNHNYVSRDHQKNRLKEFQILAEKCRSELSTIPGRAPLKIAVGVAAPAIEAWWLCKSNAHIHEAAWEKGLDDGRDPYSKLELKKMLYGSEFYSLELSTQKMTEAAQEIASDIALLERAFPHGFGNLATELRSWRNF